MVRNFRAQGHELRDRELVNSKMQAVIDDPTARQTPARLRHRALGGSVEAFAELVRSDYRSWERVVRASGVKLD